MIEIKQIFSDSRDAEIVSEINNEAFPPHEHIDLEAMFRMNEKSDAGVFGFYAGGGPVGFIWAITNAHCVYVFFLAIDAKYRGQGYGTQAIDSLFRFFSDKQVVLDIEELDPSAENYAQRVRRKSFYLRCGFHETGRYTMFNGKRFEALCNGGPLDTEGFLDVVLLIHELMPVYPGILL